MFNFSLIVSSSYGVCKGGFWIVEGASMGIDDFSDGILALHFY